MEYKKVLWFDLSSSGKTGWALVNGSPRDIKYGSFMIDAPSQGAKLANLEKSAVELINSLSPDIIGVEDIFCQSVTGYKQLAKLQGIIERVAYHFGKPVSMAMAAEVRRKYDLIVSKYMTPEEYKVHCDKCLRKNRNYEVRSYEHYLKGDNLYINKYDIDFKLHEHFVVYQNSIYDKRTQADLITRRIKPKKKGEPETVKLMGKPVGEFEYAKKIVIIDHLQRNYNLKFTFAENDIADAVLGAIYLYEINFLKNK